MAYLHVPSVRIAGIAAGVPETVVRNADLPYPISQEYDNQHYVQLTGVKERRYTRALTTSDLCYAATQKLLDGLGWEPGSVDALIFISQNRDYALPATACLLQQRLGLSKECYALDASLGCSGWVYGISQIAALLQTGQLRRGLLLCGDSDRKWFKNSDPGLLSQLGDPLFGSAGTATALEFDPQADGIRFYFGTDGSGFDAIIAPVGGGRHPVGADSFQVEEIDGRRYSRVTSRMKGMDVFSFGISTGPKAVKRLAQHFGFDYQDADYFIFHQANMKLNDMIVRKLRLDPRRVPVSMDRFGNTSSASIPLTIVDAGGTIDGHDLRLICCGFGIGLSWGACEFRTGSMKVLPLVEVPEDKAYDDGL